MHIPENYLAPASCAVMAAAMIPVWTHAVRKIQYEMPKEKVPMIGVGAAFSFLGMMFNVPLIGGTTGHAVGGTLVALLLGPDAACAAVSVALLLQAVIFGDGGILAFGANCFNMAFVLPYTGYAVYHLILRLSGQSGKTRADGDPTADRIRSAAVAIASYLGINAAALCTAVEFGLQPILFHDSLGRALYCPYDLTVSIPAMMIPHLAVAGLVEAVFTVAVFSFVRRTAPDMIFEDIRMNGSAAPRYEGKERQTAGHFPLFVLLAVMIAATPLGLLATGTAWGEWGTGEIAEIETAGQALGYIPAGMEQGWSFAALMPDYTAGGMPEAAAYILSAVIGAALLVILFKLFSLTGPGSRNGKTGRSV